MDDDRYMQIITDPIRSSAGYKPKFGRTGGAGMSLDDFLELYRADPFYVWFGLDDPLLYAAHKAAGGMTSIYRQIGLGCERLFRAVLQDALELSDDEVQWSYAITTDAGRPRQFHLDGRISLDAVSNTAARRRLSRWMRNSAAAADVAPEIARNLNGVVFEVRQGYKSKDSKRQNADVANAAAAYARAYLPCLFLLSGQIDADIALRYREASWVLLTGSPAAARPTASSYAFMADVVGYDLAAFFSRNQERLRAEVAAVLTQLLDPTS